jgi:hypothetical protein
VLGCSGQSDDSTVPEGNIRTMTMRWAVSARTPTVLALVVDDMADDGATALRNGLANAAWLQDQPVALSADFCPSSIDDPMHFNPIDLRTVVVHPSALADQRLVTPNEAPALSRNRDIPSAPRKAKSIKLVYAARFKLQSVQSVSQHRWAVPFLALFGIVVVPSPRDADGDFRAPSMGAQRRGLPMSRAS